MRVGGRVATGLRRAASAIKNIFYSVGDGRLAQVLGWGVPNFSGAEVNEITAMSLSAFYRAVSLVAGTIGTLTMRQLRQDPATGLIVRMPGTWAANPGGQYGPTPVSWQETVVAHMMVHGNAFLRKIFGAAGQLLALQIIHPGCVTIQLATADEVRNGTGPVGGKWFFVSMIDGTQLTLDALTLVHIPGLSLDGIQGISLIAAARNGLGTTLAADRAAARIFSNGAMISGIVSADEDDLTPDEAAEAKAQIMAQVSGWDNAGGIPVINRRFKFQPMQMTAADAQFLESRAFQIEEISRWTGVPPHLLMQTDKQTSWGTGVEEQNNGLSRFTLHPWTVRLEQALSRLLPTTQWIEFDYASLERPTPEDEIALIISQVQAGILTKDEARALRNLPPLPEPTTPPALPAPEPDPAEGATP